MGSVFNKEENPIQHNATTTSTTATDRADSVISSKHNARQPSIRIKSKQPMPDPLELEMRFTKVLVCTAFFLYMFVLQQNITYHLVYQLV